MTTSATSTPTILIVAYRSDDHVAGCLASLGDVDSVLVVDNGASPATEALVAASGARYLSSPSNVGFAAAVNLGLAAAWDGRSDVLLLNPDARISMADVEALHRALHAPETHRAAVGPKLVDPDGSPQRPDWPLPSPGQVWLDALGLSRMWRGPRFVVGAVLLLNGAALAEIGHFDERYFLYAEEADWQLRAQRSGWTVAVVADVTATHVGGASSNDPTVRDGLFHDSAEVFARRWYGRRGWAAMRAGSLAAAYRRSVFGPAEDRFRSRVVARRYLSGPSSAPLTAEQAPTGRHVVHVVRSDAFAGVERYIADTATALHERGWRVTVIGGEPNRMRSELPVAVAHHPAATVLEVTRALRSVGRCDIVHAHMTAAELPAALLKGSRRPRLVATRHFATPRGRSPLGRLVSRFIERQLDLQIAISQFVADSTDSACVVIHNGVAASQRAMPRDRVVLVLQRLESEKDTAVALRAWALSGGHDEGWRLAIRGRGSEESTLRRLASDLGISDSVDFLGFTWESRTALAKAGILLATAPAEPFGLAVVEAMAEATAVIAADGGAHRETLGPSGVYFVPGDIVRCAEILRRLTDRPDERSRLGQALQRRYLTNFTIAAHVERLETAYATAGARR